MKRLTLVMALALALMLAAPAGAQEKDPEGTVSSEPGVVEPDFVGPIWAGEIATFVGGDKVDSVPAGARAKLVVTFTNGGEKAANDAKVTLGSGGGINVVDGSATLGDIKSQGTADGTFVVDVLEDPCEQDFAGLSATVTSSLGESPMKFGFPVLCPGPRLWLSNVTYKGEDGDNVPEPGETLDVFVELHNAGRDAATDVRAKLTIKSGDVTVTNDTATWPDIASGKQGTNTDPFSITIAKDAKVEKGCSGGPGPDIMPVPAEDTPADAPPPSDQPVSSDGGSVSSGQTEPGSAGSGSGGSTGTAPGSEPITIEPAPPPRGSGDPEPEPYVEPDPSVSFEGNAAVTASGKSFDVFVGTMMVCALEGRPTPAKGTPDPGGAAPATDDKTLAAAERTGARDASSRGSAAGVALLLMVAAGSVLLRYRFGR